MYDREMVLKFSLFEGFGYQKIKKIKKHFGSLEKAFVNNSLADWRETGIPSKLVIGWLEFKKIFKFQSYLENLKENGINYLDYWDKSYPLNLKNIYSPPAVLYWRGNKELLDKIGVAVVGTRNYSSYGRQVTESLVKDLVANKMVIISGLAIGIDAIAHVTALENKGETIAVLGGSLEQISPAVNTEIGERILREGGVIVSEMPVGGTIGKWSFPARNRIVSALSQAVLVVEAPAKSGALITANFALEQGRSVMAVPGSILHGKSTGCHNLIKEGALLVSHVKDILMEMGIKERENKSEMILEFDNDLQAKIISCLESKSKIIDEIVIILGVDAGEIIAEINLMYLKGWIGEESGGRWYRKV